MVANVDDVPETAKDSLSTETFQVRVSSHENTEISCTSDWPYFAKPSIISYLFILEIGYSQPSYAGILLDIKL